MQFFIHLRSFQGSLGRQDLVGNRANVGLPEIVLVLIKLTFKAGDRGKPGTDGKQGLQGPPGYSMIHDRTSKIRIINSLRTGWDGTNKSRT